MLASLLFIPLLAVAASSTSSSGPVRLHTVLEPNKQVMFSGTHHGEFRLKIRNSGRVPVIVTERQANGTLQERERLNSHDRKVLKFSTGSTAIVRSLDARPAELEVKFFNSGFDGVIIRYASSDR